MMIYKIFRDAEWRALQAEGRTKGAPVDIADGYVHFSTAAQVKETAAKHFAGEEGLWLLGLETETMAADLRWETSRGGADFPHLYRDLALEDVVWAARLPLEGDAHVFPDTLT